MALYTGFSTVNRVKRFKVNDFELAKQDLYNALHIKQGEKLMNAKYGTIIWGMLFEPLTDSVREAISNDLIKIVNSDPRLHANNIQISQYDHGLQVAIELTFIETNQVDVMKVNFDNGQ